MLLSIDTSVHQNIVGLLWNMWNGMKWMTKWLTKKRQPAKHSPKHSQSNNRGWTKIQNTEANVVDSWYFFSLLHLVSQNGKIWQPNPILASYLKLHPRIVPVVWIMLPLLLVPVHMLSLTHQCWQVTSQDTGDSPLASESCSMHVPGVRYPGYLWASEIAKLQKNWPFRDSSPGPYHHRTRDWEIRSWCPHNIPFKSI